MVRKLESMWILMRKFQKFTLDLNCTLILPIDYTFLSLVY